MAALFGFASAFGFGFPVAETSAEDIYVNNVTGDDKFNGQKHTDSSGNNSGPVKSIARAIALAKQGDKIIIQKTMLPYRESLSIQGTKNSGTSYLPFTITSNGAILDGTVDVPAGSWEHYRGNVFRFLPQLKSFQQIYLNDKPAERVFSPYESVVPDLNEGQWALVDGWIYFGTDGSKLPRQYSLRHCRHQTGITLYEVHDVIIEGLIIQGFQLDGVNAHEAVSRTVIRNCRIRGNGRSGVSIGGVSRMYLAETLLGANGNAQVRSEGYCLLNINDCRILESESTGPAIKKLGGTILVDGEEMTSAMIAIRNRNLSSR